MSLAFQDIHTISFAIYGNSYFEKLENAKKPITGLEKGWPN